MLRLHLVLAWRSIRRAPGFAATMVVTLALALASWVLASRVLARLDENPLPGRPIYAVLVDRPRELPTSLTQTLAPVERTFLYQMSQGELDTLATTPWTSRVCITYLAPVFARGKVTPLEEVRARFATADLFSMFEVPLAAGRPFAADDEVVVSAEYARRVYGSVDAAIGRPLTVDTFVLRVVGVIGDAYARHIRLYDPRSLGSPLEPLTLPVSLGTKLRVQPEVFVNDGREVRGPERMATIRHASLWVMFPDERSHAAYRDLARAQHAQIFDATAWQAVWVRSNGPITVWPFVTQLTLVACLLNIMRLMIAKFTTRSHDLGVLRAFGARRWSLVGQLLLEAGMLGGLAGFLGGVIGVLALPWAAVTVVSLGERIVAGPIDVVATTAFAIVLSCAAAVLPAIRIALQSPARQLRRT